MPTLVELMCLSRFILITIGISSIGYGDAANVAQEGHPSSQQEQEILLLNALARRNGATGYQFDVDQDSIMDMLGRSEIRNIMFL